MISKRNALVTLMFSISTFFSCSIVSQTQRTVTKTPQSSNSDDTSLVESILATNPDFFDSILKNRKQLNVQVIYTQIDRDKNGNANLQNHYFNLDTSSYYYPASTVKLPVVLLALQKLNELKSKQIGPLTTMLTDENYSGQSQVFNDPTTPDGRPCIANYIKKILMVSDNDAFNRLYEFLGQDYINEELKNKGYADAQIIHRLNIFLTEEENRHTNAVTFYDNNDQVIYQQEPHRSNLKYATRRDSLGKSYYSGNKLINRPMDFSKKNRLNLLSLHKILLSIVLPENCKPNQRFDIGESDRQFVLKYMSEYPTESTYPPYGDDTANYWPAYGKFLLFGASKDKPPVNLRIFNKIGDAYGQMIDAAYIVDFKNNVEFLLSAVIYCNSDGIINDDNYNYETIGLPFMKHLGQTIYNYELKRKHSAPPNLHSLIFTYDK